jgi:hypothetical protein
MIHLVEIPLPIACENEGQPALNRARETGLRVFQARIDAQCFLRVTVIRAPVYGIVVALGTQPRPRTPPHDIPADDGLVDAGLAALRARLQLPTLHELPQRFILTAGTRCFTEAVMPARSSFRPVL